MRRPDGENDVARLFIAADPELFGDLDEDDVLEAVLRQLPRWLLEDWVQLHEAQERWTRHLRERQAEIPPWLGVAAQLLPRQRTR